MRKKLDDAPPLDVVVLDHQQPLPVRCNVALDAVERMLEVLRRRRLEHVGKGAVRQAVLPLFFNRQHLHRDVPRGGIQFEIVQHRPAEHVGEEDVERDRGRPILFRQQQRRLSAVGDDALESLVARQAEEDARVMGIVVDDEQDVIAIVDVVAIVRHHVLDLHDRQHRECRCDGGCRR